MKDSTKDFLEGLIIDPSKVDLRECIIFPELNGLVLSLNDALDIVHQMTSRGLLSKEFIDTYGDDDERVAYMKGYNKGLESADIAIRVAFLSRFKKR